MRGDYQHQDRPFNQAALLMERLDQRLNDLDTAYTNGNHLAWYKIARAVYINSQFKFEEEERDFIEKKLGSISAILGSRIRTKNQEVLFFEIEKKINTVWKDIINLLYKYEILYPHYVSKTWEEVANEEDT
jgi:hypothetical protein